MAISLVEDIIRKLKLGILPDEFMEEHRIVDPSHPAAQIVSHYNKRIIDRLLTTQGIDPASAPFQYLLVNDDKPNAFMVSIANPQIIAVTKGLLATIIYEDELAGIDRHELEHKNLSAYRNTKFQEWLADQSAPDSLQAAGYHPEGLTLGLRRLSSKNEKSVYQFSERELYKYVDVHPDLGIRIRDLENHAVIKTRREGNQGSDWTPVDKTVQALAQTATTKPRYIERLLLAAGYDQMSSVDKLLFLGHVFEREFTVLDRYFESRVEDFSATISALKVDFEDPEQRNAFYNLVDRFLIQPDSIQSDDDKAWSYRAEYFYTASYKPAGVDNKNRNRLEPLGRLKELDQAIVGFMRSPTIMEAERYAIIINDVAQTYDFTPPHVAGEVTLSRFTFPSDQNISDVSQAKKSIPVDWTPHVEWANQTSTHHIRYALQRLGVGTDPRLASLTTFERKNIQVITREEIRSDLQFNQQGEIIGAGEEWERRPEDYASASEFVQKETIRINLRDQSERRLSEVAEWTMLETEFDEFTKKYQKYLTPEHTAVEGGDTFAREFVSRIESLIKEDPSRYTPLMHKFMTAQDSTYESGLIYLCKKNHRNGLWFMHGLPVGMNVKHPYVEFVLRNKDIFKSEEIASVISFTAYQKTEKMIGQESDRFAIVPELIFGPYPDGINGLIRFFNARLNDGVFQAGNEYTKAVIETRLYAFLEQNKNASVRPSHMQAIRGVVAYLEAENRIQHHSLDRETSNLLKQQIEAQAVHDLRPEATAQEVADTYVLYVAGDSFSLDTPLRRRYEAAIMERASALSGRRERQLLVETLLYAKKVPTLLSDLPYFSANYFPKDQYTGQLHSHDFRDWAVCEYVNCIRDEMGVDDGSGAYCQRMIKRIGDVSTNTTNNIELNMGLGKQLIGRVSNTVLSQILPRLAEAVNAQPNTAYYMRDIWNTQNLGTAIGLGYFGGGIEISLDVLAKNAAMRQETIDFLTSPFNKGSALQYGRLVNNGVLGHGSSELGKLGNHFWNDSTCVDVASSIHDNFWRAPMEARGWYIDKILFPVGNHNDQSFKNAMHLVMNKTFPGLSASPEYWAVTDKRRRLRGDILRKERKAQREAERERLNKESNLGSGNEDRNQKLGVLREIEKRHKREDFRDAASGLLNRITFGRWDHFFGGNDDESRVFRQIVESYIEVVPVEEQRLLLTAIIASRDVSQRHEHQTGNSVRPGQFASQVLAYMDEMGGKVLQAINSHPAVSREIKEDTKGAKSDYNRPKRWDAVAWCQQYGIRSASVDDRIIYYGKVEASGSMGFTMFNRCANGNLYADTLLRPHAPSRCEREAENIIRASRRLAEKNPRLSAAVDIAEVAKRHAFVETCMSLAHKQGIVAKQTYNGLKTWASVKGKEYHLTHITADVTQHSEGGKRARVIVGIEFNKLPETTQEECDYKKACAIQLFGTELLNKLKGLPGDGDRHGANQKINGETVGHFDFGMTELVLPTEQQKRVMVRAVIRAYRDHLIFYKDTSAALEKYIRNTNLPAEEMHYLQAFKRQMLSWGDVEAYLSNMEKKAILGSILMSNKMDPLMQDEICKELGPLKPILVNYLTSCAEKYPIFRFDDSDCASSIVMPVLTEQEQAIVNGLKITETVQERVAIYKTGSPHVDDPIRQVARISNAAFKLLRLKTA